jgi:hypothetical protein
MENIFVNTLTFATSLFVPTFVAHFSQTAAGLLVVRASAGAKIPRRMRERIYEVAHLAIASAFWEPC